MSQKNITNIPVIIGAGLTGMAISRQLSRKKIPHVLIGTPPDPTKPRPGESLDLGATLDLVDFFPDLLQFCVGKSSLVYYHNRQVTYLPLDLGNYPVVISFFNLLGYKIPDHYFHVDRLGFDQALFQSCLKSPFTIFMDERVEDFEYDAQTDRMITCQLSNGEVLEPSFIFDASNQAKVIPRKLDIPYRPLSKEQRVLFTHYHRPAGHNRSFIWQHSTNLVRLDKDTDQIAGMAWCIPLGEYLSVGVSTELNSHTLSDEQVMKRVDAAFNRRGIDYTDYTHHIKPLVSFQNQYGVHEKVGGSNWVLAGGTYAQTWFMNSDGVGSGFYVAHLADQFLQAPQKMNKQYIEQVNLSLIDHQNLDRLMISGYKDLSPDDCQTLFNSLLITGVIRIVRYAQLRNSSWKSWLSGVISRLLTEKSVILNYFAKNFSKAIEEDLSKQTEAIHVYAEAVLAPWRNTKNR